MEEQMKKLLGGLGLLTLMAFSVFAVPSQADTVTKPKTVVTPRYRYDVSKEVTLKGTISTVVKKPSTGTLIGKHLILATSSGSVDAHIGTYAGRDKRLDTLAPGQSVSAVGVKMNVKGKSVFIVRTIEVDGQSIAVRNQRGFFVGPASPRAASTSPVKGVLR
jgi:hypothetical protein